MAEDLSSQAVQGLVQHQQSLANLALTNQHIETTRINNQNALLQQQFEADTRRQLADHYARSQQIADRPAQERNAVGILDEQIQEANDLARIYAASDPTRSRLYASQATNMLVEKSKLAGAEANRQIQQSRLHLQTLAAFEQRLGSATPETFPLIMQDAERAFKAQGAELPAELRGLRGTPQEIAFLRGLTIKATEAERLRLHAHEVAVREAKDEAETEKKQTDRQLTEERIRTERLRREKLEREHGAAAVLDAKKPVERLFKDVKDEDQKKEIQLQYATAMKAAVAGNRTIDPQDPEVQAYIAAQVREHRLLAGKMKYPDSIEEGIVRFLKANPGASRQDAIAEGKKAGVITDAR